MKDENGATVAQSEGAESGLPRWAGYLSDRFIAGLQFLAPFIITSLS